MGALDKARSLGLVGDKGRATHARLLQDPGRRIRVGDVFSPVSVGDPAPGGGIYRSGQYAPKVEDLAMQTFAGAHDSGIVFSGIDVFDESGNIDLKKVEDWSPRSENIPVTFTENVPSYSSIVIASAIKSMPDGLAGALNMSVDMAPRYNGEFGGFVVATKTAMVNRKFYSTLYVYPDFYKFIDKPLVPKNPKNKNGVSIATFMTYHAFGHALFSKLASEGNLSKISVFMDSSGWTKKPDSNHLKSSYMGRKSTSAWYRESSHVFVSELSRYSPMDDFAQAFAYYLLNPYYLQKIEPEKYDILNKIIAEQGVK